MQLCQPYISFVLLISHWGCFSIGHLPDPFLLQGGHRRRGEKILVVATKHLMVFLKFRQIQGIFTQSCQKHDVLQMMDSSQKGLTVTCHLSQNHRREWFGLEGTLENTWFQPPATGPPTGPLRQESNTHQWQETMHSQKWDLQPFSTNILPESWIRKNRGGRGRAKRLEKEGNALSFVILLSPSKLCSKKKSLFHLLGAFHLLWILIMIPFDFVSLGIILYYM